MNLSDFLNASMSDWIRFFLFCFGIVFFIGLAEKTRSHLGWSPEVTRKLVHVLTGLLVFFSPYFFSQPAPLLWMAILFIFVNAAGIRSGKLKGMHDTSRTSYGTVFYPLSFFLLVLFCWHGQKTVLMLSMLILAISDAAAAIVGENLKKPHEYKLGRDKKSIEGSSTMLGTAFLLVLILLPLVARIDGRVVSGISVAGIALATACIATAFEALSSGGSDNLSTPLGAAFVLYFLLNQPEAMQEQFYIGLGLAFAIAVLSYTLHFLTASGSVATFILATFIFGAGGWSWTIPILVFFILSSLLSKVGKKAKSKFTLMFEKSSRRDVGQVIANGGVAGSMIVGSVLIPHPFWYLGYLAALAAVTADTWATELGVFSTQTPVSIKTWKTVDAGTSGGITLLGIFAAIAGAALIGLSGLWMSQSITYNTIGWIVFAGLLASLVDSVLGATIQAQYQCPICLKATERRVHCDGQKTKQTSGLAWLNNDWVNLFCAMSGVLVMWVCWLFFI